VLALPTIISFFRSHGYTFVNLLGDTRLGYLILTSNGGIHTFGTPWYGSDAGRLPARVTPVRVAAAPATGGYWILKSNGGVDSFHAPWHGSLNGALAGTTMTAIAGQ
jgi:hypothetical protein